jgi:glycine dehydrogenase subunit 2
MTQINQSGWKPEMKALSPSGEGGYVETFTGNRALMLEEALIFETGGHGDVRRGFC